jgi:N-methylhydantoinase A
MATGVAGDGAAPETAREVFFPEHGFVETPIVHREAVRSAAGPLVVESMDSTVVVPPQWRLDLAAGGLLELTR